MTSKKSISWNRQDPHSLLGIGTRQGISNWMKEGGWEHEDTDEGALLRAAEYGKAQWVDYLIKAGADFHADREAPLRWASEEGHAEVVRILIEAGANVNISNEFPLKIAADGGHLEVVKLLVEAGADIHIYGEEPLREASRFGHAEVVKFLLSKGANPHAGGNEAIRAAAANDREEVVRILIEAGAGVRAENDEALVFTCESGNYKIAKMLLDAGAYPKARGGLPLKLAVLWNHKEIVRLLLERGDYGEGAIRNASKDASPEIKEILKKWIGEHQESMSGKTPLNESPDSVSLPNLKYNKYGEPIDHNKKLSTSFSNWDAHAFWEEDGDFWILKPRETHPERVRFSNLISGRVWADRKIISFWTYPEKRDFFRIIKGMEKELKTHYKGRKIDLMDGSWMVEILTQGGWKGEGDITTKLIPVPEYQGSESRGEKELGRKHNKSPLEKEMEARSTPSSDKSIWKGKPRPLPWRQALYAESQSAEGGFMDLLEFINQNASEKKK